MSPKPHRPTRKRKMRSHQTSSNKHSHGTNKRNNSDLRCPRNTSSQHLPSKRVTAWSSASSKEKTRVSCWYASLTKNGKAFRADPNKNKVTYNFITGEDYGFKKKTITAPKGMSSDGVGDMFQVLREASSKNEQAQLLKQQQKEEESLNRERDKSNGRGQRDSLD